jgi:hypothetical protein
MGWPNAEDLLAGPRGRRLCWSLLDPGEYPRWDRVSYGAHTGDLTGLTDELAACVARTDIDSTLAHADQLTLLAALVEPVETARYWQEPDDEDHALSAREVRDVLLPVAQAVTTARGARWWPSPIAADGQQYVQWLDEHGSPPALAGAAAELAAWRTTTIDDERSARKRPKDPSAAWSGHWWSVPIPSRLPSTTRSIPGLGAVGLALIEDGFGQRNARCWPVEPRPGARIYEISSSCQWTELVGRYPVDVSKSRRHDWWRATGWAGRWLIPDFVAVAADYDAVHLSVAGYLATAGRALSVDDARTVLAGWNPDETFWLTEVLTSSGPPTNWVDLDDGSLGWTLSDASVQPE